MKSKKLKGLIIAMPTPLLKNEDIDLQSLYKLIDYCINEGANGIAGTMGEGPALIASQMQLLVETTVTHAAGRIPDSLIWHIRTIADATDIPIIFYHYCPTKNR